MLQLVLFTHNIIMQCQSELQPSELNGFFRQINSVHRLRDDALIKPCYD